MARTDSGLEQVPQWKQVSSQTEKSATKWETTIDYKGRKYSLETSEKSEKARKIALKNLFALLKAEKAEDLPEMAVVYKNVNAGWSWKGRVKALVRIGKTQESKEETTTPPVVGARDTTASVYKLTEAEILAAGMPFPEMRDAKRREVAASTPKLSPDKEKHGSEKIMEYLKEQSPLLPPRKTPVVGVRGPPLTEIKGAAGLRQEPAKVEQKPVWTEFYKNEWAAELEVGGKRYAVIIQEPDVAKRKKVLEGLRGKQSPLLKEGVDPGPKDITVGTGFLRGKTKVQVYQFSSDERQLFEKGHNDALEISKRLKEEKEKVDKAREEYHNLKEKKLGARGAYGEYQKKLECYKKVITEAQSCYKKFEGEVSERTAKLDEVFAPTKEYLNSKVGYVEAILTENVMTIEDKVKITGKEVKK